MQNGNGARKGARVVVMAAACVLIALVGAKAFAEDADDATWHFGYKELECGGNPYLVTSSSGTIRREAARRALHSYRTGQLGDDEAETDDILRGERPVPNAGPCENPPVDPGPSDEPPGVADVVALATLSAAQAKRLEEARAILAAVAGELEVAKARAAQADVAFAADSVRAALDAVGASRARLGAALDAVGTSRARLEDEYVGYADDKCEEPVETTQEMSAIEPLVVAGDVRSFKANDGPCMRISPTGG